jgi:diguanylate cyclase (GGDEF)-like protein/PAS domain S-box-containing protein
MQEELMGRVVNSIAEGVYFIDGQKRITFWNNGAERITGYTAEEVFGSRCSDNILRHIDATGRELCVDGCPMVATMDDLKNREAEILLHHKDGHRVPVTIHTSPILGPEGSSIGAIEIFSDKSERSSLLDEMETLKKEALIDPLTGLGNRRFAEINVQTAFCDLEVSGLPFGLLILDIDNFKRVNDEYGHTNGDRTLRMIGWTLANAVRRNDAAVRWGGDEFLVICPRTDLKALSGVAERSRAFVERSGLTLNDGRRLSVTVSLGGSTAHRGDSFEALVARADELLYVCKAAGRNCCEVAD